MDIGELVGQAWNHNLLYRIFGIRRTIKGDLFKHMMGMYERMEKHSYDDAKRYGYIEVFKNNIDMLREKYYDTVVFEAYLKQYVGGKK